MELDILEGVENKNPQTRVEENWIIFFLIIIIIFRRLLKCQLLQKLKLSD